MEERPPHTRDAARREPERGGDRREPDEGAPPPVFPGWPTLYVLVIAELVGMIALCAWLSRLGG